ncbi:MAG: site-specific DNA-methyltransferase [Alphaproteobacteria bacterium]
MAQNLEIQKIDGKSMDIEAAEKDKLKAVFPECFNEGKLNIDKLLSLCGEYIDNDFEKYKFEWKGKSECYRIAGKRSTGTLRPCKEESVDFDKTNNLYIEGDNLEVLKLLQSAYYRKVKMIYIDPPYNTGNDFVYEDDFKDPLAKYKEVTSQTTKSNPETMGRYHTNWLNMMYPRLRLAANLLRDDGVIFISIDDNEVTNLRRVCDEVFGEENFVAQFPWRKRTAKSDVPFGVSQDYEWVLCYAKSSDFVACIEGRTRKYFETDDLPGKPWRIHDLTSQRNASERPNSYFTMVNPKTGKEYPCNPNRTWAVTKDTFTEYYKQNRIVFPDDYDFLNISKPAFRYFKADDMEKAGDKFGFIPVSTKLPDNIGMTQEGTKEISDLFEQKVFGFPKPLDFIKYFVKVSTATSNIEQDIVLDFFSGSATTAHAVMQLNAEDSGNRQFIMVQLPEVTDEKSEAYKAGYKNICEIGKERIRRAGAKIKEQNSEEDTGFKVLKLDSSNLAKWDDTLIENNDMADLFTRMDSMDETIKKDRSDLDVVFEVMLKLGIPLTYSVNETTVGSRKVYSIGDDGLVLICLDKSNGGITPEDITTMCDLTPAKIIAAEEAFKDDIALSNAYYISKDKGIEIELL